MSGLTELAGSNRGTALLREEGVLLDRSAFIESLRPAASSLASASCSNAQFSASGVPSHSARCVWSSTCERDSGCTRMSSPQGRLNISHDT